MKKPHALPRRASFRALLKKGYLEMREEAQRIEREFARLDRESLRQIPF